MKNSKQENGYVHSIESFGTVDGPGIRSVVFLSGCPLRCQFCHNIDMKEVKAGKKWRSKDLIKELLKSKNYFDESNGGVTFSGGEPTFQQDFLLDLLKNCKKNEIHTAVDTSLYTNKDFLKKIIPYTDLFMVSLKHMDDKKHKELTGVSNKRILENLRFLSDQKAEIWIRFLILPGITDTNANLTKMVDFLKTIVYKKIDLLSYHTMGIKKWKELGLPYKLKDLEPPSTRQIKKVEQFLKI